MYGSFFIFMKEAGFQPDGMSVKSNRRPFYRLLLRYSRGVQPIFLLKIRE